MNPADPRPDAISASIAALAAAVEQEEGNYSAQLAAVLPSRLESARNLVHYLGLRRHDIHRLQLDLAALGLSSLGRSEGHVRDTLLRLGQWLTKRSPHKTPRGTGETLDSARSESLLHANTQALFGARPHDRHVYIMVTAPDAGEVTIEWTDKLLQAGADILRINGAHEAPPEWEAIASTFKSRAALLGRPGRVIVDLPGPKLRTEIHQRQERVIHLPRIKDRRGRTITPTTALLVGQYEGGAQIPVPAAWMPLMQSGDAIDITDAGGRHRTLHVRILADGGTMVECDRSLFISSGLELTWQRGGNVLASGRSGSLPDEPAILELRPQDTFLLNATGNSDDAKLPALALAEPQWLNQLRAGERVILDDGKVIATIEATRPDGVLCRVQRTVKTPVHLRTGKGIAFPDSELVHTDLSAQDEAALAFAFRHADAVGVSFVNTAHDVARIGDRLRQAPRPGLGMILKLETRAAMRNLPSILMEALRYEPVGLMIARGDLAVEVSFERLAEMQEELLWFGEACHLPVIWATQVLDTVAHSGMPTRAEVTDAAMAMRAECVMLNKGPHVATAVRMLADIIRKMETHQYKKRSLYRQLSVAERGN